LKISICDNNKRNNNSRSSKNNIILMIIEALLYGELKITFVKFVIDAKRFSLSNCTT